MNKDRELQKLKIKNFALICGGTAAGTSLAFILCWTVPIICLFSAKKPFCSAQKDIDKTTYWDRYAKDYNEKITDLSQIPFLTYHACKSRADATLNEYKTKQRS